MEWYYKISRIDKKRAHVEGGILFNIIETMRYEKIAEKEIHNNFNSTK